MNPETHPVGTRFLRLDLTEFTVLEWNGGYVRLQPVDCHPIWVAASDVTIAAVLPAATIVTPDYMDPIDYFLLKLKQMIDKVKEED